MSNDKTVLVTGNFNVLHPGHIRLFKFAKSFASKLIVGVYDDSLAGTDVDVSESLRIEAVGSVEYVDQVILIAGSLKEFILKHRPDFILKGKEFEKTFNEEAEPVQSYGGQIIFSSGEFTIASNNTTTKTPKLSEAKLNSVKSFMQRHLISVADLSSTIENIKNQNVCVIGDLIVDQYIDCFPLGMSQEEPTIVVSPQETEQFIGGAGIVASHAAQLGAAVSFLSVTGHDSKRDWAAAELEKLAVDYHFFVDQSRPTTVKQRFRSQGKSLLRVSNLTQQAISSRHQELLLRRFEKSVKSLNLLVLSDFNYGCLPQDLVDRLITLANEHGVFVAADSQSSSQVGDIGRFKRAHLITPTEREARISLRNQDDGLVVLADKLLEEARAENIILKLGGDGLILQSWGESASVTHTDRIEALNENPNDVSGAGDSLLITASLAMATGSSVALAGLLGSLAAFVQVGRKGNIPLTPNNITEVLPW